MPEIEKAPGTRDPLGADVLGGRLRVIVEGSVPWGTTAGAFYHDEGVSGDWVMTNDEARMTNSLYLRFTARYQPCC